MNYIDTSLFELYKIGPGPSSSHTLGPMKAGLDFRSELEKLNPEILNRAKDIKIYLYGSLSATGKGHGTDRAVLGGLRGCEPESCNYERMFRFFEKPNEHYEIQIKNKTFPIDEKSFIYGEIYNKFPFANTLIMRLECGKEVLFEKEYYSIGGGFIKSKGEKEKPRPEPKHLYSTMKELQNILKEKKISLVDLMLENEMEISKISKEEIFQRLTKILQVMKDAVHRGVAEEGVLPGPIKLERKARRLFLLAEEEDLLDVPDNFLIYLDAFAFAASEENAVGHMIVTTPTNGACGVMAAIVCLLEKFFHTDKKLLCEGLIAAAAIGFLAKHNASIAGAEVGCQGEVGVASSMGAALLAYVDKGSIEVISSAAEIALEHQLGLTCDPIMGYVQIPCIERNAIGAVTAYNAYLLASQGDPKKQKISFDSVVKAMLETGRDMCQKYKETSTGGLALCDIEC